MAQPVLLDNTVLSNLALVERTELVMDLWPATCTTPAVKAEYAAATEARDLLDELEAGPPYEEPLSELSATLGQEALTLAAVLEVHDVLQTRAHQVPGLTARTTQVMNRCLELSASPTAGWPPGF